MGNRPDHVVRHMLLVPDRRTDGHGPVMVRATLCQSQSIDAITWLAMGCGSPVTFRYAP
jgi:hypothetical protein